jgi:hypothetical protein
VNIPVLLVVLLVVFAASYAFWLAMGIFAGAAFG